MTKNITSTQSGLRETQKLKERKNAFLELFSRESQSIRNAIAADLPAYNSLLNLDAMSFEELALRQLAENQGIPKSQLAEFVPPCPFCGPHSQVKRKDNKTYRCQTCRRTFTPNYNSISSGTKCDAIVWMKLLQCLISSTPMAKTCELCGISDTTYFRLRNKLFYAMKLLLDGTADNPGVCLSGNIQVDNTFVRMSFKGIKLDDPSDINDFPENSIFFYDGFRPRTARKRGRPNRMSERGANSIVIFTAIDDRGRVLTRYAGTGATNLQLLRKCIPDGKILAKVSSNRQQDTLAKRRGSAPVTKTGDRTLIIADKERAIESYARFLGVDFESHVYRDNGTQRKLPASAHDIQRVNALHKRLKKFLTDANYVSTKYLPGYLILFEFLENFDQEQAINELFKILAQPNLGKPAQFYQDQFSVPNYLEEWFESSGALRKLPYNKLLAFYLYDQIRNKDDYPCDTTAITMDYITSVTSYVPTTIRRSYRELEKAGYRKRILEYFGEPTEKKKEKSPKPPKQKKVPPERKPAPSFHPAVLAIYDDYMVFKKTPKHQRLYPTFQAFLDAENEKYGTHYTYSNIHSKFTRIRERGLREARPPARTKKSAYSPVLPRDQYILQDFNKLFQAQRELGELNPSINAIHLALVEKYNLSLGAITRILKYMRSSAMDNSQIVDTL